MGIGWPATPLNEGDAVTAPLAPDFVVVAESPDPALHYAGSPCLIAGPDGRLLASYEWFQPAPLTETLPNQLEIAASEDEGASWRPLARLDMIWPSLFVVGAAVYLIGNRRLSREIVIQRSRDGGVTWSSESVLFRGPYHNAPTSVLMRNGQVYRAFETCPPGDDVVGRGQWRSLVVAGDMERDLLDPAHWRMSNQLPFPEVPWQLQQGRYAASYEDRVVENCWIEGNVIDVRGELRVLLRTIIDGYTTGGIAAVNRVVDAGDDLRCEFLQFHPMPGAQCKFHIVHDAVSDLFWTAVNLQTNSWQDRKAFRDMGFTGPPGNERRLLMLMYSLDALNWFQAGCIAMTRSPMESFSYASLLVRGADLLVLSRTSLGGRNQHDTNRITLHRVKRFRQLALDLTMDMP